MNARTHLNGDLWSVQVYDLALAPASGWFEVARLDRESDAQALTSDLLDWHVTASLAAVLGGALDHARHLAEERGHRAGVVAERKRAQDAAKAAEGAE